MRRRCELLALWFATGCTRVFGIEQTNVVDAQGTGTDALLIPDLDRDGILDNEDTCIASIADSITDFEGDSFLNGMDGCPFDYESIDSDSDGIFDECDPLPALAGDKVRCIMAFQNPTITRELLVPRPGETATWNLLALSGVTGVGTGTLVATEPFEAPTTTIYDLLVFGALPMSPATDAAFTLWLRTSATAAATDVGCELRGDASATTLTLRGSNPSATGSIALPVNRSWKLQAIVEPSVTAAPNVRCIAREWTGSATTSVSAQVALPEGTPGFGVTTTTGQFAGLTVIERADAPPL